MVLTQNRSVFLKCSKHNTNIRGLLTFLVKQTHQFRFRIGSSDIYRNLQSEWLEAKDEDPSDK